jgi:hypothetical protein
MRKRDLNRNDGGRVGAYQLIGLGSQSSSKLTGQSAGSRSKISIKSNPRNPTPMDISQVRAAVAATHDPLTPQHVRAQAFQVAHFFCSFASR